MRGRLVELSNKTRFTPRLLPDEPLPPYTFVPGRHPHPESDPAGHSFGRSRPAVQPLAVDRWSTCQPYLRGLDLFNHGFFWESHVEFESLWLAAGRHGETADFLKGLIHLAAAGVKYLEGKPAGVQSHARRAGGLFERLRADASPTRASWFGLHIALLAEIAQAVVAEGWLAQQKVLLVPDLTSIELPKRQ